MTGTPRMVVVACGAAVVLLGACGQPADDASDSETFWEPLRLMAAEVEGFDSLSEMGAEADIVAQGHISDYGLSREFQGDAPEDVLHFSAMMFDPSNTLTGHVPETPLPIEFTLTPGNDDPEEVVARQAEHLPDGEILVFLRAKRGEGEEGLYRLVNSTGLWVENDGGVTAPLTEDPLGPPDEEHTEPYHDDIRDISSLDQLADAATTTS